jgi:hypothetical protein
MGMVTAGVARFQGKALQRPLTAALIAGLVRGGEGVSIDGAWMIVGAQCAAVGHRTQLARPW